MAKIPFRKVEHETEATSKLQDNVEEALNRLGAQTLDDVPDGKTYRKLVGVNFSHQLTASGIATGAVLAPNVLTVSGTSLLPATVPVSALAACNQFSVYRDAAFTMPAGAYSALYANQTLKDTGSGWSAANAWYQIPTDGDYQFTWCMGALAAAANLNFGAELVVNSGRVLGSYVTSAAIGDAMICVGTYMYVNARAGDRVKAQYFNAGAALPLLVTSGYNYFQGWQIR